MADTRETARRPHYGNIQATRGVAAFMVAISHAQGTGLLKIPFSIEWGASGVDLFFVISGFIICNVAGREQDAWHFAIRRFARVFPLYWVVLAVSVAASLWIPPPESMQEFAPLRYIALAAHPNRYVPQAWSMSYEIYFYGLASAILLLWPRRIYQALGAAMLCHAALMIILLMAGRNPDQSQFTSGFILEFGLGCGLAWIVERRLWIGPPVFGLIAICLFAFGAIVPHVSTAPTQRLLIFGLGSATLLYALLWLELQRGFVFPRLARTIGDASYSLYLWHWFVLSVIVFFMPSDLSAWQCNLITITYLLIIVCLSWLSYHAIEMPALRSLTRLLDALTPKALNTLPGRLSVKFNSIKPRR